MPNFVVGKVTYWVPNFFCFQELDFKTIHKESYTFLENWNV